MFTNAHDVPDGASVSADLCIVGAGAAGIALALEYVDTAVRVVVLENGGLAAESDGQAIYRVLGGAAPTLTVDPSRTWYFGGNTNHWAANCRPLDALDFEARDWVPYSGWPISPQELLSFYQRAQTVCGLGEFRWYDLEACRPHLRHQPLAVDPAALTSRVMQACPVPSFAERYSQRLAAATNIRVLLRAHALRLGTNGSGTHVQALEAIGLDGRRVRIEAGAFVLAGGGIENARLLLCSNGVNRRGLANDHDLVGRFFMEHWYVDIPLDRWGAAHDLAFYSDRQFVDGTAVWGQLMLSDERLRSERVAGLSVHFVRAPAAALSADAARRVLARLRRTAGLEHPLTDLRLMLSDPAAVITHGYRKLRRSDVGEPPRGGYTLRVQLEQTPHRDNRVQLSPQLDRFGQPSAELQLHLSSGDRQAHTRSMHIVGDALGMNGRRLARQLQLMLRAGQYDFFWHHMGTTRMHRDPTQGVVDGTCRVHGITNLFVAGASLFPTAGIAPPTLTIVALALRLADHLKHASR